MAKQKWTEHEKLILSKNISDGMLVSDMCKLIPNHPESGIIRVVQALNFGIKTKNGVMRFYANKKTRNRTKKSKKSLTIVGEPRTAETVQEPTITLEKLPKLSDVIIAKNSNNDAVITIYNNISTLIMSGNYTSVEISAVTSDGLTVTVSKKAS